MDYTEQALNLVEQMEGALGAVRVALSERPDKRQRICAFRALAGVAASAEILKLMLDCSGVVHGDITDD